MTRRERIEARLERRREWAESRDRKAAAGFEAARRIADGIPLGQPVLVGHYSERRHRRDLARIDSGMSKGCESMKMAEHHRSKASGLGLQLERSIFSDDPDAVEALEAKAAGLDASAARKVAINKAWRKGKGAEGWGDALGLSRALQDTMAGVCKQYSWLQRRGPEDPSYDRANARRCRERIKAVREQQERQERAESAAGGVLVEPLPGGEWVRVTFPEKPEREVIDSLKAAGFRWGGGCWAGRLADLPPVVFPEGGAS